MTTKSDDQLRYMTPEDFAELATAVFKTRGNQALIASHMGVSVRTLRRWMSGDAPIPASACMLLQALAQLKLNALPLPVPPVPLSADYQPEPPLRNRLDANYPNAIDWKERTPPKK